MEYKFKSRWLFPWFLVAQWCMEDWWMDWWMDWWIETQWAENVLWPTKNISYIIGVSLWQLMISVGVIDNYLLYRGHRQFITTSIASSVKYDVLLGICLISIEALTDFVITFQSIELKGGRSPIHLVCAYWQRPTVIHCVEPLKRLQSIESRKAERTLDHHMAFIEASCQ